MNTSRERTMCINNCEVCRVIFSNHVNMMFPGQTLVRPFLWSDVMDRSNQKPILPGFSASSFASQFPGLPSTSANAFMSTLQSLQMQSLGLDLPQWTQATPAQQQAWLEQTKVAAMLPMYAIVKQSEQAANALSNQLLEKNGLAFNLTQNSIFPNAGQLLASVTTEAQAKLLQEHFQQLAQQVQDSHQSTSTPGHIDVGTHSQPMTQPHSQASSSRDSPTINVTNDTPDPKIHRSNDAAPSNEEIDVVTPMQSKSLLTEASTSKLPDTVARPKAERPSADNQLFASLKLDTLNRELNAQKLATALAANTLLSPRAVDGRTMSPSDLLISPTAPRCSPAMKPGSSPSLKGSASKGQQDDALDSLFTMVDQGGVEDTLFHEEDPNHGGLSPVQFTPPDSPTFGVSASTSKKAATPPQKVLNTEASTSAFTAFSSAKKTQGIKSLFTGPKLLSTSMPPPAPAPTPALFLNESSTMNGKTPPATPATPRIRPTPTPTPALETSLKLGREAEPPMLKKKERAFRTFAKSSKVPVYKLNKINALVEESKTKSKTAKDVDAFEFDDEEDIFGAPEPKEKVIQPEVVTAPEVKKQNVYVPGVGYAISAESTKTVNKKRVDRPGFMTCEHTTTTSHSEIVTLAESIRRRRNARLACEFLKPESGTNYDCAKAVGSTTPLPLPKIVITRKFAIEEVPVDKRKRKRQKQDSDDDDWGGAPKKGPGRPKLVKQIRRIPLSYELSLVDQVKPTFENTFFEDRFRPDSKRGRQIAEERKLRKITQEAAKSRLSKFGPADGILPKGTYVVCKADLIKEDCAIWRVDNQNLLQKFMPKEDPQSKVLHYKSSSTYSGWCEQISSQYYRVSIIVIKHTRSETIIRPEIPLLDLFPAMSIECHDQCEVIPRSCFPEASRCDETDVQRDSLKSALNSYLQALVTHALTLQHMQTLFQKKDPNFMRSLVEIDKHNKESIAKIVSAVHVPRGILKFLETYVNLHREKFANRLICCQVCNKNLTRRVVQLFSREFYDPDTLMPQEEFPMPDLLSDAESDQEEALKKRDKIQKKILRERQLEGTPLPAMELYTCKRCAGALYHLHELHHLKFHLFTRCEIKLELIGTQHPEYAPERVVEVAKKDRGWFISVINEYASIHKEIAQKFT